MTDERSLPAAMRDALRTWARRNGIIRCVYVFGSRAAGRATAASDLDIALVLDETHGNALSELIVRRRAWRDELTRATGVQVRDIYLAGDQPASGPRILVYDRDSAL